MTSTIEKAPDYTRAPAADPPLVFEVPYDMAGLRLDQALSRLLPQHSRSRLQDWIRAGRVRVDGAAAEVRGKLRGGERIALVPEAPTPAGADRAQAIALDIVYEDEALLVVNKPPGLVVHPGSGVPDGTLLNAVLHHAPPLAGLARAGIVHRLDKDTSGLLVVAKTETAQTHLVRQLQARSVKRIYLALAEGCLDRGGSVDAPIGRHPLQRTRMAVVAGGREARTHVRVVERFAEATLIECSLETGRTHQIRVHLAHIGHALVGDPVYGRRRSRIAFDRQTLHARRLELIHPVTGSIVHWEAPLPEDMAALLQRLREAP